MPKIALKVRLLKHLQFPQLLVSSTISLIVGETNSRQIALIKNYWNKEKKKKIATNDEGKN